MTSQEISEQINIQVRQKVMKDSVSQIIVADMLDMILAYAIKNIFVTAVSTSTLSHDDFKERGVVKIDGPGGPYILGVHFDKAGETDEEKYLSDTVEMFEDIDFIPDTQYLITFS